ncbi:hypothetical protein [Bacillus sp. FJAT-22090]|uniref:hypothetical protein n=1 Tax=Bacillus sp. FJAT-22090 TaxID=1581038 RepID=UPI0011AAC20B|nr:hypothetical protein [Bacillus sp. FJAT-22090]
MHQKKIVYTLILIFIILLFGCTEKLPKESTETKSENAVEETKTDSIPQEQINNGKYSLEKKLMPPKFFIKNFNASFDETTKEIIYQIEYQMDSDIYESLTIGNQKLYFSLIYPESIQKYFETHSSPVVESIQPSNNELIYAVDFRQKIIVDFSKKDIENITKNLENYNLYLIDKDKDVIAMFNDILLSVGYKPGISDSEHIDETQ